jgi:dipeptidase E
LLLPVRLYLSSFGLGNQPEQLVGLLRGGKRVGVVLNAKDGSSEAGRAESLAREIENLAGLGLEPTELDLRHYFGRPVDLEAAVRAVDLVWVRGGNTFVLRRAFKQSGADLILTKLLHKDALVFGGFSAAIAVLTPSLRGLELVDDPTVVPDSYDPAVIWEGLNLLPYAVAPHYRSDHPESPAIEALVQHFIDHHIPFRALRDGEVIVIDEASDTVVR